MRKVISLLLIFIFIWSFTAFAVSQKIKEATAKVNSVSLEEHPGEVEEEPEGGKKGGACGR